jgi:hypothetical protein
MFRCEMNFKGALKHEPDLHFLYSAMYLSIETDEMTRFYLKIKRDARGQIFYVTRSSGRQGLTSEDLPALMRRKTRAFCFTLLTTAYCESHQSMRLSYTVQRVIGIT